VPMIAQLTSRNMRFHNYIHVCSYEDVIYNLCLLPIFELIHTINYILTCPCYVKITNVLDGWSIVYVFLSLASASLLERGTCLSKRL